MRMLSFSVQMTSVMMMLMSILPVSKNTSSSSASTFLLNFVIATAKITLISSTKTTKPTKTMTDTSPTKK